MPKLPTLLTADHFTQSKLQTIRTALAAALENSTYKDNITLVATGSYGRGEASAESDLDWFLIFDKDLEAQDTIPEEIKSIADVISRNIDTGPGDSQTFGKNAIVKFSDLQSNIGGQHDTNKTLTRRLLFLLEGTWLYGEERFKDYRCKLLTKYIKPDVSTELPYFLLNDIIRYYRTMATDFEYKVVEGGKAWGLRNIKLRFSRKLLYFGGVIVMAELNGLGQQQKLIKAEELFDKNVLERITFLDCNAMNSKTTEALALYSQFLESLSDSDIRAALDDCPKESRNKVQAYVDLKVASEDFSKVLHDWLLEQYPSPHPIHHALVF